MKTDSVSLLVCCEEEYLSGNPVYLVVGCRRVFLAGSVTVLGQLWGMFWDVFVSTPTAETPSSLRINRYYPNQMSLELQFFQDLKNFTEKNLAVYFEAVESGLDWRKRADCFTSTAPIHELSKVLARHQTL